MEFISKTFSKYLCSIAFKGPVPFVEYTFSNNWCLLSSISSLVTLKWFIVRKFSKAQLKFNTVIVQSTEVVRGVL